MLISTVTFYLFSDLSLNSIFSVIDIVIAAVLDSIYQWSHPSYFLSWIEAASVPNMCACVPAHKHTDRQTRTTYIMCFCA